MEDETALKLYPMVKADWPYKPTGEEYIERVLTDEPNTEGMLMDKIDKKILNMAPLWMSPQGLHLLGGAILREYFKTHPATEKEDDMERRAEPHWYRGFIQAKGSIAMEENYTVKMSELAEGPRKVPETQSLLENIKGVINGLEDRLSMVISQGPTSKGDEAANRAIGSPLKEQLEEIYGRLNRLFDRIDL